ncbi:MAG: CoA-binding protein [Candidatus Hydrogenedentes bacterium]|nr:CoA-binding protein [Candidatus Hydrogenedentota bacterium]
MTKTIAVIGASPDRKKFGNKCVRAYQNAGWTVYPVNPNCEEIEGLQCYHDVTHVPQPVQRVSMYVPPAVGKGLLDELCEVHHQELWLNPGAEDQELIDTAKKLGLNPIKGCSIVDIGMSPAMFP